MGRLYSYDTQALVLATAPALRALASHDLPGWRLAVDSLRLDQVAPDLGRDSLPQESSLASALLLWALEHPRKATFTGEPRPSTFYRQCHLPDEVQRSRTWRYVVEELFAPGEMPDDLWFMYGDQTSVTTNWLTAHRMREFLAIEASESLVTKAAAAGAITARDLRLLVTLFEESLSAGWDVYLFDPGS